MKTVKVDGMTYIMVKTKKGWRYSRVIHEKILETSNLADLFNIEMDGGLK